MVSSTRKPDPTADVLTVEMIRDAMQKIYDTPYSAPCGSEERPHVVNPRYPKGRCLTCGAWREEAR